MESNSRWPARLRGESNWHNEFAPDTDDELIELIPAIFWRANAQTFQFTFVSSYAETLLGYPSQVWVDTPTFWRDHIHAEDREWAIARRNHAAKEGGDYDLEYRMISRDGRALWVRELGRVYARGIAGVIVDLSKKRSAPLALGEGKRWLRQLIDTIPVQIWSGTANGSLDFCNAPWRTELGLSQEELQGDGWQKILQPADRDRVLQAWQDSVRNGAPYEQEERHLLANGRYRWFLCRGVPLREDGKIVRWFGSNTDIQAQKEAEAALRKSEQRWRQIFENTRLGVAVLDQSLHFIETNEAYQKIVGYRGDELRSMTSLDMTHEEDRPACELLIQKMVSGQVAHFDTEKRYIQKNGETIWVHLYGSSFDSGGDRVWVAMVADVSERRRLRDELHRERDRLRLLLDLSHRFVSKLDLRDFFASVLDVLQQLAGLDSASILLPDPKSGGLIVYLSSENSYLPEGYILPMEGSLQGRVYQSGKPIAFRIEDLPELCAVYQTNLWMGDIAQSEHIQSGFAVPLIHEAKVTGVLYLLTRAKHDSATGDLSFLQQLANLVATSLSNALRFEQVNQSREQLVDAKNYIQDQIRAEFSFETIVGVSQAIKDVLRQVDVVAPTDSSVLILGETGTGKELIARAIHDRGRRSDQSFIKVDCSAIPSGLIESELFGHEKGAFTGATAQRPGRFEIADKGTLFLDEVGDIPLELQPKLLRVLQDQTLERLGSNRTRHLDVRIVAATNRDLEKMVEKGQFREDLYYRLKVFPITIPPLRERPDDIPPLVQHYVAKYSHRMKQEIKEIPAHAMEVFIRYPWPGNVRELQHFLERSVILSPAPALRPPLAELEQVIRNRKLSGKPAAVSRTMAEIERDSILQALRDSNWVVGGPHGAAAKLGLKRTTLASRMESLGITRSRV